MQLNTALTAAVLRLQTNDWLNIGLKWVISFISGKSWWPLNSFLFTCLCSLMRGRQVVKLPHEYVSMYMYISCVRPLHSSNQTNISYDLCEQLLRTKEWNFDASLCCRFKSISTFFHSSTEYHRSKCFASITFLKLLHTSSLSINPCTHVIRASQIELTFWRTMYKPSSICFILYVLLHCLCRGSLKECRGYFTLHRKSRTAVANEI